jgi:hypothetical protein
MVWIDSFVKSSSGCVSLGFIAIFGEICLEMSSTFSTVFFMVDHQPFFSFVLEKVPTWLQESWTSESKGQYI